MYSSIHLQHQLIECHLVVHIEIDQISVSAAFISTANLITSHNTNRMWFEWLSTSPYRSRNVIRSWTHIGRRRETLEITNVSILYQAIDQHTCSNRRLALCILEPLSDSIIALRIKAQPKQPTKSYCELCTQATIYHCKLDRDLAAAQF